MRHQILCTRQIEDKWIAAATQHGINISNKDFIKITPIITETLSEKIKLLQQTKNAAVVFTSKNAVEIAAQYYLQADKLNALPWKVYCLEGATKKAVEAYFNPANIMATALYSDQLADIILQKESAIEIHFFCGDLRREELPEKLKASGKILLEYIIYETRAAPQLIKEKYDGILFFSPSAAKSFFSVNAIPTGTVCFAIGETTAAVLRELVNNNKIILSKNISTEKMIETVVEYFDK